MTDPATAQQDRRERYEGAIIAICAMPSHTRQLIAHASMVLADVEQADLKAEVEHVKAENEVLAAANDHIMAHHDAARDEVDRLRTEATWDRLAAETGAELDAPTEPAPGLEVSPDAPSPTPDGYGRFLGHVGIVAHDPPSLRTIIDPLPAIKARLDKAMRGMEPTSAGGTANRTVSDQTDPIPSAHPPGEQP